MTKQEAGMDITFLHPEILPHPTKSIKLSQQVIQRIKVTQKHIDSGLS